MNQDIPQVKEKFVSKKLTNNKNVHDSSLFKPTVDSNLPQPIGFHLNKSKTTELD